MKSLAVVIATTFSASPVGASECEPQSPKAIAATAQVAFLGTVISVEESSYKPSQRCWDRATHGPKCGGKLVTLQVTDRIRGQVDSKVTVMSEDACYCLGPYWDSGMQYLVIAQSNITDKPGQFVASNQCEGTMEINKATQPITQGIIAALRASKR
jgi:hypothetical protein